MRRHWITFGSLFLLVGLRMGGGAESYQTADGFAVPRPGREFVFPRDHGSHPEFKIEWWYLTGHLVTKSGRRFGYQATFFRRAGERGKLSSGEVVTGPPIYLGHMALLDVGSGRFLHQERVSRQGWDAGASEETLAVHLGPWSLGLVEGERMKVRGSIRGEGGFELELVPRLPLVLFGKEGVSKKGDDPTAASHYLTYPRLKTTGRIQLGVERLEVEGESWMDHEMSSSQLAGDQVGWDWACLHLKDGRSVMVYQMRRADGKADRFSTLAWVDAKGRVESVGSEGFRLSPRGFWKSPRTGAEYPSGMELATIDPQTKEEVKWQIIPLARDQELTGRVTGLAYWEGGCRVVNGGGEEIGSAFLELTGYSGNLARSLR